MRQILNYIVITLAIIAIFLSVYCMVTSAGAFLKITSFVILIVTLLLEIISNIISKNSK